MLTGVGDLANQAISSAATIDSLLKDGHPAHIQSRIFDQEEKLYHERFVRRLIIAWLTVGNVIVAAVAAFLLLTASPPLASISAAVVLVVSIAGGGFLYYRQFLEIRASELHLRKLHQVRKERLLEEFRADDGADLLAIHKRYREETPDIVDAYRTEASRYRRVHNIFQGVIIVGSIVTSTSATASVLQEQFRWATVGISVLVGIAAGFTGYFKYRERSFNLQQTADSIERQYYSVELRVGRYRGKSEADAYADFANEVEWLREEQSKRQQQLEQPPEAKPEP